MKTSRRSRHSSGLLLTDMPNTLRGILPSEAAFMNRRAPVFPVRMKGSPVATAHR